MSDESSGTGISGHCLCGKVRLRAWPEALHADACHCGMCRRWSGGPFMTIPCGTHLEIEQGSDVIGTYGSSDWGERCFCRECGSILFYRFRVNGLHFVSAGLPDDVDALQFTTEIFIDSKPDWYAFANPTRKMTAAEVMAAFGAE